MRAPRRMSFPACRSSAIYDGIVCGLCRRSVAASTTARAAFWSRVPRGEG
jgi:hypothetical protein